MRLLRLWSAKIWRRLAWYNIGTKVLEETAALNLGIEGFSEPTLITEQLTQRHNSEERDVYVLN